MGSCQDADMDGAEWEVQLLKSLTTFALSQWIQHLREA
jgi:hypothetical protein